jgi:hypothetical protein
MRRHIQSAMCLVRVRKRTDREVLRELRFTHRQIRSRQAAWRFSDSLG